jgi:hypothetical protein
MCSLARFWNKNYFSLTQKRSSLLQRWRFSCKFQSRRIGSYLIYCWRLCIYVCIWAVTITPWIRNYFKYYERNHLWDFILTSPANGVDLIAQCCQMVYFQTKNRNLGKFRKVLQWKMLVFFVPFWYSGHLVVIWYMFPVLVYCTEKNLATL